MENPFKNIIRNENVPESLRSKVMNDVELIKLTLSMADLIAIKYPSSVKSAFDLLNSSTNKKKRNNEE